MNSRIGIDENTLCRQSLRAVAGHCVPVIKVAVSKCIELDLAAIIRRARKLVHRLRLNRDRYLLDSGNRKL
jgi:hypothetical protein